MTVDLSKVHFDHLKEVPADGRFVLAPGVELVVTAERDYDMLSLLDRIAGIFDRDSHIKDITMAVEECLKLEDADGLDDMLMQLGWIDNDNYRGPEVVAKAILALLPLASMWDLFGTAEVAELVIRKHVHVGEVAS